SFFFLSSSRVPYATRIVQSESCRLMPLPGQSQLHGGGISALRLLHEYHMCCRELTWIWPYPLHAIPVVRNPRESSIQVGIHFYARPRNLQDSFLKSRVQVA